MKRVVIMNEDKTVESVTLIPYEVNLKEAYINFSLSKNYKKTFSQWLEDKHEAYECHSFTVFDSI